MPLPLLHPSLLLLWDHLLLVFWIRTINTRLLLRLVLHMRLLRCLLHLCLLHLCLLPLLQQQQPLVLV